jgi:hypothetical protein
MPDAAIISSTSDMHSCQNPRKIKQQSSEIPMSWQTSMVRFLITTGDLLMMIRQTVRESPESA